MYTSIVLSASQLTMSAKFQSMLEGDTIYATGEDLSRKTFYDSLTKTIKTQATFKPKAIPVKFQKVTETRHVAIETVTTSKQEQQIQTIRTENNDKQLRDNSFPVWLIILGIILIVGVGGFLVMKFKN